MILRMQPRTHTHILARAHSEPSLRPQALQLLQIADPRTKADAARALLAAVRAGGVAIDTAAKIDEPPGLPGRPALPRLVPVAQVAKRSPFTLAGRAALLHAIAHIEFNAINHALDAIWRFAGMPEKYYRDWLQVAGEEALHFTLLSEHLATLGQAYGDFDAHDGLWRMTEATQHDIVARMALVPRTLDARGLDATPPLQAKLRRAGDERAVQILDVILRDEIGHVAIGNHWYRWLCEREGLEPIATFARLALTYGAPRPRGPFNVQARLAAGFTQVEVDALHLT